MKQTSSPACPTKYESKSISLCQFKLIKTIGTGSFGIVKLGKDKITGRYVAIKILDKQKLAENTIVIFWSDLQDFMNGVAQVFVDAGSIDGKLDSYVDNVNVGPLQAASDM